MLVSELIGKLQALPQDARVHVDVEVESGFYDVPARHASGVAYYVQHWPFHSDSGVRDKVTLCAKNVR